MEVCAGYVGQVISVVAPLLQTTLRYSKAYNARASSDD